MVTVHRFSSTFFFSLSLSLFAQNKLPRADIGTCTLWLSVWDWDRFGRNKFLGEVRLPLSSLDLTDSSNRWYDLEDPVSGLALFIVVSTSIENYQ